MQTRTHSRIRLVVTALAVAGIAMFVFTMPTQARVKGPRFDSHTAYCGSLQDRADQILADIWTNKQATEAQVKELVEIGGLWNTLCRDTFGSIVRRAWVMTSDTPGSGVLVAVESSDMPIGVTVGQVQGVAEGLIRETLEQPSHAIAVVHKSELSADQVAALLDGGDAGDATVIDALEFPPPDLPLPDLIGMDETGMSMSYLIMFGKTVVTVTLR
jgi:hypothetical protein